MAKSTTLTVRIMADASQAASTLGKSSQAIGKFQSGIQSAALPAAAIGAGAVAFGKNMIDAASRAQQGMGAIDSVFKKNASTVKQWAADASGAVGLSQSQYAELATVVGAQLGNMGLSQEQVLKKTQSLVGMGADLAATYGGTTADAVAALSSALRGETDPIERYGISVKQADVAAKQAAQGTAKLTGEAGKAAKTNALLALVNEQAAAANGQFARESTSAAGAQERATAEMENAKVAIGQGLLPMYSQLMTNMAGVAQWAARNAATVKTLALVIGVLAAAILGLNVAAKVITSAIRVWTAVQWAWNAAMSANPLGLVVIAVIAVIAVLVLAYKKSATFRNIVQTAFRAIVAAGIAVKNALVAAWKAIRGAAESAWSFIKQWVINPMIAYYSFLWKAAQKAVGLVIAAWQGMKNALRSVYEWIKSHVIDPLVSAFDAVISTVERVIGWIKKIKIPNPVKALIDKGKSLFSAPAAYTIAPAPYVIRRGARAAPGTTAAPEFSGRRDALAALNTSPEVIVQVSDRKMAQLVDVSVRANATAATRTLTRRRVVTV